MPSRASLKKIDLLRHELKALRYILDGYHAGGVAPDALLTRNDLMSEQGRAIFDAIIGSPSRAAAEAKIADLDLPDVDIGAFLRLTGEHYYTYPALVRERAAAIAAGRIRIEDA